MVSPRQTADAFVIDGEVVEILQEAGASRAKVLLGPGTVLDLALAAAPDVHLGDHVEVSGAITVERIRTRVDAEAPTSGAGRRVDGVRPPPE